MPLRLFAITIGRMSRPADYSEQMEEMLRWQIAERGVGSPAVLEAMRQVPRERFVPIDMLPDAYTDQALPIGHGQTISQPFMVALMTEAIAAGHDDRVLEIGTGSGYQTAILAKLAKRIYTIERIPVLMQEAKQRLRQMGIDNVEYRAGDGTLGWPEDAPFDRILIAAAAPTIPAKLLESQLADGGIAVLPAGMGDWQYLWKISRRGGRLQREDLGGCRFVRLIGAEGWDQ